MDIASLNNVLPDTYLSQGLNSQNAIRSAFINAIAQGTLPEEPWCESTVEKYLNWLSEMDTNNFVGNIGVGEREGRIYSNIVRRRHFSLSHGIGRSGDITAVQPKAAGSSIVNKVTNTMALSLIRHIGIKSCKACFVVPMATGMSLTLCLMFFKRLRPHSNFVIWSRIDQKTCYKCMITVGLVPLVVNPLRIGDELRTNSEEIRDLVNKYGAENITCIFSTTSCFAPRVPDDLETLAEIAKSNNIPHLVNNAYGLQLSKCSHLIEQATKKGRLDIFVQSTDKNFMVPVGGSIIAGFDKDLVHSIAATYPGRASAAPTIDLLTTLLSMGKSGYTHLLTERKACYQHLVTSLKSLAMEFNERVLETKGNQISVALTLSSLDQKAKTSEDVTMLGSMLFARNCSGARVVARGVSKTIEGQRFGGYGAHCDDYPCSYINAAAAIGMTTTEVDKFVAKLRKCLLELRKS